MSLKQRWINFNNWLDPRCGVHILWLMPVFYIIVVFEFFEEIVFRFVKRKTQDNIEW